MQRSLNIQAFGTVLVIATFISSEAAAWYLIYCPSCLSAWYLNLGPFHVFEAARGSETALRYLFAPSSLPIAVATLLIVILAWRFRIRFLIALGANLTFAFALAIVEVEVNINQKRPVQPSIHDFLSEDFAAVLIIILAISFVAFMMCHASFIADILVERKHQRRSVRQISPGMLGSFFRSTSG